MAESKKHYIDLSTEDGHQYAVMLWAAQESVRAKWPELARLYHIENERRCSPQEAEAISARSGGSLVEVRLQLEHNEWQQNFHQMFTDWMRICFRADIAAIQTFSERMGALGREPLKFFFETCLNEIQGCLLTNNHCSHWIRAGEAEKNFWKNFSSYVSNRNIHQYYSLFDRAIFLIGRNIYTPALITDTSLAICRILREATKELKKASVTNHRGQ